MPVLVQFCAGRVKRNPKPPCPHEVFGRAPALIITRNGKTRGFAQGIGPGAIGRQGITGLPDQCSGARARAAALVGQACDALSPYGTRADTLREAARFAISRDY